MKNRLMATLTVLTAMMTLATASAQTTGNSQSGDIMAGAKAPDFKLTDVNGKTYRLSDYRDKVVVLEWWRQDCPVTLRYMPTMIKLAAEHAKQGVVWLAIDSTHYQTATKNAEFIKKNGITYPVLMDTDGKVGRMYGAKTTPHMYVINKGKLAYSGGIESKEGRNYVAEALTALSANRSVALAKTQPTGCPVKYAPVKNIAGVTNNSTKAEVGQPAPNFSLTGVDGKSYDLSNYKDKLVVLEWWNRDCPVTRQYTNRMKDLATQYAKQGVVWMAVDSTHYQTPSKALAYHRENEMPYPVLHDKDGKVGRMYNAKTTPHMFVINKGTLVYSGAIDNQGSRNYVTDTLDAVLAGREVPLAKTQPFGCSVKYAK